MAVQAHFPSLLSVLTRAGRDAVGGVPIVAAGYASPVEPIADYFDTSNMLFTNGATTANPKKRTAAAMNVFSLSPPPEPSPRRPTSVSTGLRLSSCEQSQNISQTLALLWPLLKQHSEEIDRYLRLQAEELRRVLTETRRRHHRALMAAAEEVMVRRLREKDAVIENVCRQNAVLEARAAELSLRAEEWRALAAAQEAAAAAIQEQLQQAVAGGWSEKKMEEAGACSGGGEGCVEDAGSEFVDPERAAAVPACRVCGRREAVVVLLPCRHLCVCRQCDDVVLACPLCSSTRTDSMEALLV